VKTTTATKPPDHLVRLGADLQRAARGRIARLQRRRRRIEVGVAVAVAAALMAGIGLAASGVDVLGLIRSDDPGNARFQIDRHAHYHGPAPQRLACTAVTGDAFTCAVGRRHALRTYTFLDRVERPSQMVFARERLLRSIDRVERRHLMRHKVAARLRRDVEAVDDQFFRAMQRLPLVGSVGAGVSTRARGAIVPPPGVPMLVFCDAVTAREATCHPLAGAVGVPARAPFYQLEPTADWVRLRHAHPGQAGDFGWELELVLGRPLNPAEIRLLTELAMPLSSPPRATVSKPRKIQSSSASGRAPASPEPGGSGSSSGGFSSP
jgi:hypothetical protein